MKNVEINRRTTMHPKLKLCMEIKRKINEKLFINE